MTDNRDSDQETNNKREAIDVRTTIRPIMDRIAIDGGPRITAVRDPASLWINVPMVEQITIIGMTVTLIFPIATVEGHKVTARDMTE